MFGRGYEMCDQQDDEFVRGWRGAAVSLPAAALDRAVVTLPAIVKLEDRE